MIVISSRRFVLVILSNTTLHCSAVDAHVGRSLFDKLIGNTGLLAGRTRVLVTHNLAYLHRVDRVLVMDQGR